MRYFNLFLALSFVLNISCKENKRKKKTDPAHPPKIEEPIPDNDNQNYLQLKQKLIDCYKQWTTNTNSLLGEVKTEYEANTVKAFVFGAVVSKCLESKDPIKLKTIYYYYDEQLNSSFNESKFSELSHKLLN